MIPAVTLGLAIDTCAHTLLAAAGGFASIGREGDQRNQGGSAVGALERKPALGQPCHQGLALQQRQLIPKHDGTAASLAS
jgi:hypothetical protein